MKDGLKHFYLLGILPPGNIAREIQTIRYHIFKSFGYVSSQVFPAHIPLAFLPYPLDKKHFSNIKNLTFNSLRTTNFGIKDNTLYLYSDIPNWREYQDYLKSQVRTQEWSLYPITTGFFLCMVEKKRKNQTIDVSTLPSPPKIRVKQIRLVLLTITCLAKNQDMWWENVRWKMIESIYLKYRKS